MPRGAEKGAEIYLKISAAFYFFLEESLFFHYKKKIPEEQPLGCEERFNNEFDYQQKNNSIFWLSVLFVEKGNAICSGF